MRKISTIVLIAASLLTATAAAVAQQPGQVYRDITSGRRVLVVKVDATRVYYVALDTASVLKSTFTRSYALEKPPAPPADTVKPPPADTVVTPPPPPPPPPPAPTDTSVRIYAMHDFNDGKDGPFTNLASRDCGTITADPTHCGTNGISPMYVRNGRMEISYRRLSNRGAADVNSGIKWVPKDGTQNTPFGATIYAEGVFTIQSMTPAQRAQVDSAAAALGIATTTDAKLEGIQRKLFYANAGRPDHWVLKLHAYQLQFMTSEGGAPCAVSPSMPPINVHRFTADQYMDKPVKIGIQVRRSSAPRVPDGELWVWVNDVLVKHATGFCTNSTTNTQWQLQIGQQVSGSPNDLYNEVRLLDNVLVSNKKPH